MFSAPEAPPQDVQLQALSAVSILVKWKVNLSGLAVDHICFVFH